MTQAIAGFFRRTFAMEAHPATHQVADAASDIEQAAAMLTRESSRLERNVAKLDKFRILVEGLRGQPRSKRRKSP